MRVHPFPWGGQAAEYAARVGAVGVVAAGEGRPDGTLRPCVADLLGAAAVIDALSLGDVPLSVEAAVALAALAILPDVPAAIRGCLSGREFIERGYVADVALAVEINSSRAVPVLRGGAFESA